MCRGSAAVDSHRRASGLEGCQAFNFQFSFSEAQGRKLKIEGPTPFTAKYRVAILGRTCDELLEKATREVEQLLDESIAASRSLTTELSPPILHDAGLNDGLDWLARRMADKHGLFVELSLEATSSPLAEDVKILLFESVRELLFNAVKHSRSRSATIGARLVDGQLQVLVSDQGAGFDPKAIPPAGEAGGGFGLFSIRERLELIGGRLEIESAPGTGSRFR